MYKTAIFCLSMIEMHSIAVLDQAMQCKVISMQMFPQ